MRRRLLAMLACVAACLGTALVAMPPAQAFTYTVLPECSGSGDTMCVVSATRNGYPAMTQSDVSNAPAGTYEWYYVDNGWRDGVFSFNLNTKTKASQMDSGVDSKSVDASATWAITVNTGTYYPRELESKTQNTVFTRGGNATSGYWFRVQFNPVPVAWRFFDSSFTCDMLACGNDSTLADFVSGAGKGFADGYVTDLADSPATYARARSGFVLASNAQYQAEPYYDAGANSIVVEMANPHLRAPGVAASGFFEAFLPTAYLKWQLGVPDPDSLTGGTFSVFRDGSTTSTAFALTHTSTGIWIRVHDIGFSRPRFRLHAGPSAPRRVHAQKISAHKARVRFRAPAKTLGYRINKYQARCQKPGKAWHLAKATASPITVGNLPKGTAYCQVRAHNKLGWGKWSATRHT